MRKIPHPVERKIHQPLIDSDHEVMMYFQDIIKKSWIDNKEVDVMEVLIKSWLDDLQKIFDRAERVDELENNLYHIGDAVDDIENEFINLRRLVDV